MGVLHVMQMETYHNDITVERWFKWIDLLKPIRNEMDALGRLYFFHDLNWKILTKIQLPKIERHSNYIFVIVHFHL
jgi:Mg2+ and Co2+ transporter CorA